jgi:hypothetical protein
MKRVRMIAGMAVLGASLIGAQEKTAPVAEVVERTAREPALMIGDSMMRLLSVAFEKEFRARDIKAASFASLGSGLVRLDAFDWYAKIAALMDAHTPGTVIVVLGTNDDQALLSENGIQIAKGSDEWDQAYSERLARVMDILVEKGAQRVIWILQPDMKQAAQQRYAQRLNGLIARVAEARPAVTLFDSRAVLSRRPDAPYAATLVGRDGQMIQVRDPDGVHLSQGGAERLAAAVIEKFWK